METRLKKGDWIALEWGTEANIAEVLAETDDRYLVKMDWGRQELMSIEELRRRRFVVVAPPDTIWSRITKLFNHKE